MIVAFRNGPRTDLRFGVRSFTFGGNVTSWTKQGGLRHERIDCDDVEILYQPPVAPKPTLV